MKTKTNRLWHDALDEPLDTSGFDAATLASTLARARRVHRKRGTRLTLSALSATALAAILLLTFHPFSTPPPSAPPITANVVRAVLNKVTVRYLTDDELLARFPNQAVGIVGSGEDRQFVFVNTRLTHSEK